MYTACPGEGLPIQSVLSENFLLRLVLHMTHHELLREIRTRLQAWHGPRLRGVVLYGSEARGQATPDSDIDLLVLLEDPIDFGRDLDVNSQALYPLSLQIGRRISAKPVGAEEYRAAQCPLYRNAQAEGITV